MKELEVDRVINKTANRLYPLNIPKEVIFGLGWDDEVSKSSPISVKVIPRPDKGGFFIQSVDNKPVSELRYIYAVIELKKKGRKREYKKTNFQKDKTISRVHKMKKIPDEFKDNKKFMKLWNQFDNNNKKIKELNSKFNKMHAKTFTKKEKLAYKIAEFMETEWQK